MMAYGGGTFWLLVTFEAKINCSNRWNATKLLLILDLKSEQRALNVLQHRL